MIVQNLQANASAAQSIIKKLMETIQDDGTCACQEAAQYAILTDLKLIPEDVKEKLELFYEKYWK